MRKIWVFVIAFIIFIAYSGWMIGPYLRSVIVRDAAVTSWSRITVAPIARQLIGDLPKIGSRIDESGKVVTIRNSLLLREKQAVEARRDHAKVMQSKITELTTYLDELEKLESTRIEARDRQARVFHSQVKTEMDNLRATLEVNQERIDALARIVDRNKSLVDRGSGSATWLDEAFLRLAEARAKRAELQATLKLAELRDKSADDGVFIGADGSTPNWVTRGELELKLEKQKAQRNLEAAKANYHELVLDVAAEDATLKRLSEAVVSAPAGSLVVSIRSAPGATLNAGDPIIQWIDCDRLMVDVPVSDAELPLIQVGDAADVILEGEPRVRQGRVSLTRGSSATLGATDLAAVAKGRLHGVAQVLLELNTEPDEFKLCPLGRAAYVEFPGVGLLDVIRARLRI